MKSMILHFHAKEMLMDGFVVFAETNIKNLALTLRKGRREEKEATQN